MLQEVLPVRRAESHPPYHFDHFWMKAVDSQIDTGPFPDLQYFLVNVLFCFCHNLFDPCWVDPTILDQSVQGEPGNLTSYRIKPGDDNCLGGVINYDFHPRCAFQGTDVPAFPSDDFPFDIVTLNIENRDAVFDGMLCGGSLDGVKDD